jgi:hypothetical protein
MKRRVSEPCSVLGNQRRTRPPTAESFQAFHMPVGAKHGSERWNAVQQQAFATAAMLSKEAKVAMLIMYASADFLIGSMSKARAGGLYWMKPG